MPVILETNGKKLSATIKSTLSARDKNNVVLHHALCAAMRLAVLDGRPNWINEVFQGFKPLDQTGMRAWLSPMNKAWFRGDSKSPEAVEANKIRSFLKYSSQTGFAIDTKNRMWKADAPTVEEIQAVADNFELSMFQVTKADIAPAAFDLNALLAKVDKMVAEIEKRKTDGDIVTDDQTVLSLKAAVAKLHRNVQAKPVLATVDGQRVEPKAEAEVIKAPRRTKVRGEVVAKAG